MKANQPSANGPDNPTENMAPRKPGRPRKTEADTANSSRRKDIITAAARHFRLKGFEATTTRDIASATGMQSGSPFYHFKSKNELLFTIMEEGMLRAEQEQVKTLAALAPDTSPRDALLALVRHHLRVLHVPGSDFVPVMLHEWRSISAQQRKQIVVLKDRYEVVWQALLQTLHDQGRIGTTPELARLMLFGAVHGTLRWYDPKQSKGKGLDDLAVEFVNAFVTMDKAKPARRSRS